MEGVCQVNSACMMAHGTGFTRLKNKQTSLESVRHLFCIKAITPGVTTWMSVFRNSIPGET